jgi:hypothetical protein
MDDADASDSIISAECYSDTFLDADLTYAVFRLSAPVTHYSRYGCTLGIRFLLLLETILGELRSRLSFSATLHVDYLISRSKGSNSTSPVAWSYPAIAKRDIENTPFLHMMTLSYIPRELETGPIRSFRTVAPISGGEVLDPESESRRNSELLWAIRLFPEALLRDGITFRPFPKTQSPSHPSSL